MMSVAWPGVMSLGDRTWECSAVFTLVPFLINCILPYAIRETNGENIVEYRSAILAQEENVPLLM